MKVWYLFAFLWSMLYAPTSAQTWLKADATSDPYTLIDTVLGTKATETVPDCKHKEKHITMPNDDELKRPVFAFHLHVDLDDDYCKSPVFRQRTEIAVDDASSNDIKGFNMDTVSHSWNFRLDANFQASEVFGCIHQLNLKKNGQGFPLVVFNTRKGNPDLLRIIHTDSNTNWEIIGETTLTPFKGTWVHVQETATYSNPGSYSVIMTKLSDGTHMFNLTRNNLEMWRNGTAYVRPKWGLYRGLFMKHELRDEIVKFDNFCLGKGSIVCQ